MSIAVRMVPGQTELTKTPRDAPYLANIFVKTVTAPLDASYNAEVMLAPPSYTPIEVTLMIRPHRRFSMSFIASRARRKPALQLTLKTLEKAASFTCSREVRARMAAALTRISTFPKVESVCSITFWHSESCSRFAVIAWVLTPKQLNSLATFDRASPLISTSERSCPRDASRRATLPPRPPAAPVMMATLFSALFMITLHLDRRSPTHDAMFVKAILKGPNPIMQDYRKGTSHWPKLTI